MDTPSAPGWYWLWLILTLGAVLRLYRLDGQSLWLDEGWQYFFAQSQSLRHLFAKAFDPMLALHPPLSYLIHYGFLALGDSDWVLRLPSVFFGVSSLCLGGALARQLTSPRTALYTTFFWAISPFDIWYSQEMRMYAPLLCLSLLSSLLLIKAIEQDKRHWWLWYTLATAAGMYTHIFMALTMLVHSLWVLLCQQRLLWSHSLALVTTGILCLPLAHVMFQSYVIYSGRGLSLGKIGFSWFGLPYTFFVYAVGFSLGPSVAELHDDRSLAFLWQFFPSICAVGILFGGMLLTGLVIGSRQYRRTSLLFCLLGLFTPLVVLLLLSRTSSFTFNVRYTIMAFPFFCLLIGTACASTMAKNRRRGVALLLAIVSLTSVSLWNYHANPRYTKPDIRAAVGFWRMSAHGTPLLSNVGVTAERYLHAAERAQYFPILEMIPPVPAISRFFATHDSRSAYILLERDWHQVREHAIRQAFTVDREQTYPGVTILRISRPLE